MHYPTLYDFVLFYFCMRKQLQLVKYLKAVPFVTIERVFLAGSSLSNTQIGVVGGMCSKKSGNAVIQNNSLTERGRWEGLWSSPARAPTHSRADSKGRSHCPEPFPGMFWTSATLKIPQPHWAAAPVLNYPQVGLDGDVFLCRGFPFLQAMLFAFLSISVPDILLWCFPPTPLSL